MNADKLRELAELGAEARLRQLLQEVKQLSAEFPAAYLKVVKEQEAGPMEHALKPSTRTSGAKPRKDIGKRRMSAAERSAISRRMKKYWVERRKARGKTTAAT